MKKVLALGAFAVFGIVALSSCRKDYDCVLSDGTVYTSCLKCKSNGVVYASFESTCNSVGGTVQKQ